MSLWPTQHHPLTWCHSDDYSRADYALRADVHACAVQPVRQSSVARPTQRQIPDHQLSVSAAAAPPSSNAIKQGAESPPVTRVRHGGSSTGPVSAKDNTHPTPAELCQGKPESREPPGSQSPPIDPPTPANERTWPVQHALICRVDIESTWEKEEEINPGERLMMSHKAGGARAEAPHAGAADQ
ncbi:synaptic Ras GTPase activating protein 1b [Lates japonicus]|uniref:Synaptic Ras GTPase activating protein 1b n=1 Tax=Lates japonicus TaxID=270547 RepID=A0AAD3MI45_LATJO|nr:synaptic Ras GTPase activating protein 1b [Lates japonicus]